MKLAIAVLFAGTAFGSTIPISGHGQFGFDNEYNADALLSFSGSNGVDSVSFSGEVPIGLAPPDRISGTTNGLWSNIGIYSATINGVSSFRWTVSLGDGIGKLTIFDAARNLLTSQDIAGTIETTSYQEFGTRWLQNGELNLNWYAKGTFDIVAPLNAAAPVPEAGSGMLLAMGLAGLGVWHRRSTR